VERFNIVYIDDQIDIGLSKYFDRQTYAVDIPDAEFQYVEVKYKPADGYLSLIKMKEVQEANIIFVDSKLFSDNDAIDQKISGEEFKVILRKFYPYIEVIVITQNGADEDLGTIPKYSALLNSNIDMQDYYEATIPKYIQTAVSNIKQFRRLAEVLGKSQSWEKVMKEKVQAALDGMSQYDSLTADDITNLIAIFKEIQEKIDG
jgi:hypothetical protein